MTEMVGATKAQDEPKTSSTRKCSRNNIEMSREHKNQLDWDSNGQIGDNVSIKMNDDSNGLNPLNKTETHKFILT